MISSFFLNFFFYCESPDVTFYQNIWSNSVVFGTSLIWEKKLWEKNNGQQRKKKSTVLSLKLKSTQWGEGAWKHLLVWKKTELPLPVSLTPANLIHVSRLRSQSRESIVMTISQQFFREKSLRTFRTLASSLSLQVVVQRQTASRLRLCIFKNVFSQSVCLNLTSLQASC